MPNQLANNEYLHPVYVHFNVWMKYYFGYFGLLLRGDAAKPSLRQKGNSGGGGGRGKKERDKEEEKDEEEE